MSPEWMGNDGAEEFPEEEPAAILPVLGLDPQRAEPGECRGGAAPTKHPVASCQTQQLLAKSAKIRSYLAYAQGIEEVQQKTALPSMGTA